MAPYLDTLIPDAIYLLYKDLLDVDCRPIMAMVNAIRFVTTVFQLNLQSSFVSFQL